MTGPPGPPTGTDRLELLRTAWKQAALRAGLALLVLLGLGLLLAVLRYAGGGAGLSALDLPGVGALVFYLFHHVPIVMDVPPVQESLQSFDVSLSLTVTPILGTALAGWLLFRSGVALAESMEGPPWVRAVRGLQIALVYAVLAFLVSFIAAAPPETGLFEGLGGEPTNIHPSRVGAFVWPLLLAAMLAPAGALSTVRERLFADDRGRWVRGALAGGWRMTWTAVALGTFGFLVVAALHPGATRAFFDAAASGSAGGAALTIAGLVLYLPNVGTAAAAAAMGSSVDLQVVGTRCTLISYARFPAGETGPMPDSATLGDPCGSLGIDFQVAPAGYFLFVLVPLVAVLSGGWLAARRAGAGTRREGAMVGAVAGCVFAVAMLGIMALARISYASSGVPFAFLREVATGPSLVSGFLLALVWGVAGGAAAGTVAVRNGDGPGTEPGPER